ncbi:MAG: hypothetical protein BJ554DRAFT_2350, partial [Olpidium bornovanus]
GPDGEARSAARRRRRLPPPAAASCRPPLRAAAAARSSSQPRSPPQPRSLHLQQRSPLRAVAAAHTFSAPRAKINKRLRERPSIQHRPAAAPLTVTETRSLHKQIEKIRNAAEKTASDNKRTGGQRRADADTLDPNALDVLERPERVGIQGCYDKKPIVISASDPPASKSMTPGQDGGSSEKDDTRSGHLQQTAGSASASDYPSGSKAKLQSEQTGKRQKGKGVTGDANPPGPVSSDRDTESETMLEGRRQRKDDNAVIRCHFSPSAHLDPNSPGDTKGAKQDRH